jgi:hypothetical protein
MGNSKIIFGNTTLIDLTADTVEDQYLAYGKTAHGADGELITGTSTKDSDTTDADATASEILSGKTAYVNKNKLTGEMPNRGAVTGTISTVAGVYTIQNGYHDGSGTVEIDSVEQAKIIAGNIKEGVTILGVTGTCSPASGVTSQSKTATPYTTSQTILPDSGYDYLSQVTVNAISYTETLNSAGGKTITIGDVAPS